MYYQSSGSDVAALADVVLPVEEFRARVARDLLLIIGFTLFVVLLARLSVHFPFTPAPVTGQTFAVLVTGAALGSWRGAASLALYLGRVFKLRDGPKSTFPGKTAASSTSTKQGSEAAKNGHTG